MPSLTCKEARLRMLDGEPDPDLAAHLSGCADCRAEEERRKGSDGAATAVAPSKPKTDPNPPVEAKIEPDPEADTDEDTDEEAEVEIDLDLPEIPQLDEGINAAAVAILDKPLPRPAPLSDAAASNIDDTISLYLREIGVIPLLDGDDEQALAQQLEDGVAATARLEDPAEVYEMADAELANLREQVSRGEQARKRLIQANSRLVVHIAKKYVGNGVPLQDLIQEGNLGLMRAVEKFDHHRGFKFSTYATWWIRQSVIRALADQSRTIRVPAHMAEQISRMMSVSRSLTQDLGRDPTVEEIAAEMDVPPAKIQQIRQIARRPISLELPVGEESDSEYGDFLQDEDAPDPNERAGREMLRAEIQDILQSMSPREAEVLSLRYGLDDGRVHTLEEVGERFGVTRERIRQIETKAIRRLRHPSRSNRLRDYLD